MACLYRRETPHTFSGNSGNNQLSSSSLASLGLKTPLYPFGESSVVLRKVAATLCSRERSRLSKGPELPDLYFPECSEGSLGLYGCAYLCTTFHAEMPRSPQGVHGFWFLFSKLLGQDLPKGHHQHIMAIVTSHLFHPLDVSSKLKIAIESWGKDGRRQNVKKVGIQSGNGGIVGCHHEGDCVWNHLGDTLPCKSMRAFPERFI